MTPPALTMFTPPSIVGAPAQAHRLVRAMRVEGVETPGDEDTQPRLVDLLRSADAVASFRLLMAGMAHVWPDPLMIFRPCCPRLTPDESSLLAMVHHAGRGDRRAFDRAIGEMISEDARDWLFTTAARLASAL